MSKNQRKACLLTFNREIHRLTTHHPPHPDLLENLTTTQRTKLIKTWRSITPIEQSAILIGMLQTLSEERKKHPHEPMWLSPNLGQILFALIMQSENGQETHHLDMAINFCLEALLDDRRGPLHDTLTDHQRSSIADEKAMIATDLIAMTDLMLIIMMLTRSDNRPQNHNGKHRRVRDNEHIDRSAVARLFERILPSATMEVPAH